MSRKKKAQEKPAPSLLEPEEGFALPDHLSIVVVIPAYNEAGHVADIVSQVLAMGYFVLLVDDASTDATADEAEAAGACVVRHPCQTGAWSAMQTGIRCALRQKADLILTIDGDGQHNPADIPLLLHAQKIHQADIVIGECISRGSIARHLAWALFRTLSGLKIRDITSGFRVYTAPAAKAMLHPSALLMDYQDVGVLLLARDRGLKVIEVPVAMKPRTSGGSRIFSSWWRVAYYMVYTGILSLTHR